MGTLMKVAGVLLVPVALAAALLAAHHSSEASATRAMLSSRVDALERELAAQMDRPDFSADQRMLLHSWDTEMRLRRDRGDLEGAIGVGETAVQYLSTQEVRTLAETVRAAWQRSRTPALQASVEGFLQSVDDMTDEPADADVSQLRSRGLTLLRQLAPAGQASSP